MIAKYYIFLPCFILSTACDRHVADKTNNNDTQKLSDTRPYREPIKIQDTSQQLEDIFGVAANEVENDQVYQAKYREFITLCKKNKNITASNLYEYLKQIGMPAYTLANPDQKKILKDIGVCIATGKIVSIHDRLSFVNDTYPATISANLIGKMLLSTHNLDDLHTINKYIDQMKPGESRLNLYASLCDMYARQGVPKKDLLEWVSNLEYADERYLANITIEAHFNPK